MSGDAWLLVACALAALSALVVGGVAAWELSKALWRDSPFDDDWR
jgi:hypothetical protein